MKTTLTETQEKVMNTGEKKWVIHQLKQKGITKHPQNKDSLKKYRTSELFTILSNLPV